jgi:hypothetical protein
MRRNVVVSSAVFLIAGLLTCAFNIGSNVGVAPKAQAQDDGGTSGQIEGTWLLTVTPPVPQIPTFKVFISFARGGLLWHRRRSRVAAMLSATLRMEPGSI